MGPKKDMHMPHGEGRPPRKERTLAEIAETRWLTPENASFSVKNGLLYLSMQQLQGGATAEKEQRVFLLRQFPFDLRWEYISVMDGEEHEIGIIRKTELFAGEEREILETELQRRYYAPQIQRILSVKERYGFSYWKVQTEQGEMSFTLKDTLRNIFNLNGDRVIFSDVDGNRFEIAHLKDLDRSSMKKLELYL